MSRTLSLNRGTRLSMKRARQMRSLEGAFVLASRSEVKYGNGSNSMAAIFRSRHGSHRLEACARFRWTCGHHFRADS